MTNQELLTGISGLLEQNLQPLKEDIQSLKSDVKGLKDDVQVLKDDVQGLKDDVQGLKVNVQKLNGSVQVLSEEMLAVKAKVQSMECELQTASDNLHQVKLCQENVILPRLNTIESCYTSTYNRYKCYSDKMDSVFTDITLLKETVSAHSQKFQKLA